MTTNQTSRVNNILATLDDDQILALRAEAIRAGDDLGASVCNSALRGDANHRRAVAVMIDDARAQEDTREDILCDHSRE
jgi:hypothetical protein